MTACNWCGRRIWWRRRAVRTARYGWLHHGCLFGPFIQEVEIRA